MELLTCDVKHVSKYFEIDCIGQCAWLRGRHGLLRAFEQLARRTARPVIPDAPLDFDRGVATGAMYAELLRAGLLGEQRRRKQQYWQDQQQRARIQCLTPSCSSCRVTYYIFGYFARRGCGCRYRSGFPPPIWRRLRYDSGKSTKLKIILKGNS
jgi:hypothetical protein